AQSGADGVMVGRGAQGRPWLLAQIAAGAFGLPGVPVPQGDALADLVVGHYEDMLGFYGLALGVKIARKHLGWYLEAAGAPAHRGAILTGEDPAPVIRALRAAFADHESIAA
ncbi:MAG TPA: tRNA-dihydrouridine synthase, partial [Paracoccaceae bacterium]